MKNKVRKMANGYKMHDMGDCFVVTDEHGRTIGQCRTEIEAKGIAEENVKRKESEMENEKIENGGCHADIADGSIRKCNAYLDHEMRLALGAAMKRIEAMMELCATAPFHVDLEYIRSHVAEANSVREWCRKCCLDAEDAIADGESELKCK